MKKFNVIEFILIGLLVCTAISCKSASSENTAANDNTSLTDSANSNTIAVEKPLPTPARDPGQKFDSATLIDRLKTKPADLQKDLQNKVVTVTGPVRAQNEKIAMFGRDDTAYISCNPTGKTFANAANYALLI